MAARSATMRMAADNSDNPMNRITSNFSNNRICHDAAVIRLNLELRSNLVTLTLPRVGLSINGMSTL